MRRLKEVECLDVDGRLFKMPVQSMGIIIDADDVEVSLRHVVENHIDGIFHVRTNPKLPLRMLV